MQMSWLDCKKEQEKVMYRKEIEEYIDSHKDQMIEDICTLCRINSEKCLTQRGNHLARAHLRYYRQLLP